MRVLVTGHRGYIGSVLVPRLRADGHQVSGIDTGYYDGGALPLGCEAEEDIRKDVRDVEPADLFGVDAIVHLAALSNDPLGEIDPRLTHEINHRASVRLAEQAKRAGVRRFLLASSCSSYGAAGDEAVDEDSPVRPLSAYAESKILAERDIAAIAGEDFSPVFLRCATAFGWSPNPRMDVVLNNLVGWAHTTGKVRLLSDGSAWRPLVHVEDIAGVISAILGAPRESIHAEVFNVGADDQNYRVRDLGSIVAEETGAEVEYGSQVQADPRSYRVNFSKLARRVPTCRPHWDARSGVRQVRDALRRAKVRLEDFQGRRFVRLRQLRHLIESKALDASLRWTGPGKDGRSP